MTTLAEQAAKHLAESSRFEYFKSINEAAVDWKSVPTEMNEKLLKKLTPDTFGKLLKTDTKLYFSKIFQMCPATNTTLYRTLFNPSNVRIAAEYLLGNYDKVKNDDYFMTAFYKFTQSTENDDILDKIVAKYPEVGKTLAFKRNLKSWESGKYVQQ